jgi:hypothetical protein
MLTITANQRTRVPYWAVLEHKLIEAMNEAAPIFVRKYAQPGGTLIWRSDYPGDGVWADDLYEAFFNWPTFYALGGDSLILDLAIQEWNAVTRQVTHEYGRASKEFINDDDWFHNGENYIYFYAFGLADPTNAEMANRASRFAGLYMNHDPEAPNYDSQHRLVRSPFNGSRGPLFHARYGDMRYNLILWPCTQAFRLTPRCSGFGAADGWGQRHSGPSQPEPSVGATGAYPGRLLRRAHLHHSIIRRARGRCSGHRPVARTRWHPGRDPATRMRDRDQTRHGSLCP